MLRTWALRFHKPLKVTGLAIYAVCVLLCLAVLCGMTLYVGFDHTAADRALLNNLMRLTRLAVLLSLVRDILQNILGLADNNARGAMAVASRVRMGLSVLVVLSFIPWGWTGTRLWLAVSLLLYSLVEVSHAVMAMVGRRTNPSLLLSGSFVLLIAMGTLLLLLPKCTYGGISVTDALFVSTSAVCITGLCPVDIYADFTPLGVLVLAVLVQTGGLGVMTFTSFFALFFSGRTSIYSQLLLKDVVYSRSMSSLVPTLLYILAFTLIIELIGAGGIWLCVHGTLGMTASDELIFCAFHSLSSFCNAGFSTMPGGLSNPEFLYGNQSVYWVTSALVILGGIGFPILVNFKDALYGWLKRQWTLVRGGDPGPKVVYRFDMNTRVVLTTTTILFIGGALLFCLMEYNHSLAGHGLWWQASQSFFNSVVPRSAGFASINPASFMPVTLLMVLFLMWVGGASQSAAGGVKVNTLAAIMLNLRSIVLGGTPPTAFGRTVAQWSIRRANAVVAISILGFTAFAIAVLWLEPDLPPRALLFETVSALFTVGSSLGITAELSEPTRLVLCAAMFLGRVGIISLITGLAGQRRNPAVTLPTDNLIIN